MGNLIAVLFDMEVTMKVAGLLQNKFIQLFTGGVAYGSLEIAWRGYTHVSMIILGGICFFILLRLSGRNYSLPVKSFAGAVIITALEFITGCIVNIWWGLSVWDYSAEMYNLLGQICLKYFLLWWALCAVILPVCYLINNAGLPKRNREAKINY